MVVTTRSSSGSTWVSLQDQLGSPAVPGNEPCTRKTEGELILHGVGYFRWFGDRRRESFQALR